MNNRDLLRNIQSSANQFQMQNKSFFKLNEQTKSESKKEKSFTDIAADIRVDPTAEAELLGQFDKNMAAKREQEELEAWSDNLRRNDPYDAIDAEEAARIAAQSAKQSPVLQRHPEELKKRLEAIESQKSSKPISQKTIDTIDKVNSIIQTGANIGLLFSGAGSPYAIARLSPMLRSASNTGVALSLAQAGSDYARAGLESDPGRKQEYLNRANQNAISTGIGVGAAKAIQLAGKGLAAAAQTEKARGAVRGVQQAFPKTTEMAQRVTRAISNSPASDTGGIAGGLAGYIAGENLITSDDTPLTAAGKIMATTIAGTLGGRKAAGYIGQKLAPQIAATRSAVSSVVPSREVVRGKIESSILGKQKAASREAGRAIEKQAFEGPLVGDIRVYPGSRALDPSEITQVKVPNVPKSERVDVFLDDALIGRPVVQPGRELSKADVERITSIPGSTTVPRLTTSQREAMKSRLVPADQPVYDPQTGRYRLPSEEFPVGQFIPNPATTSSLTRRGIGDVDYGVPTTDPKFSTTFKPEKPMRMFVPGLMGVPLRDLWPSLGKNIVPYK